MAKRYTEAFIAEAVKTYYRMQPGSFAAVAAHIGVYSETLRRWVYLAERQAEPTPLAAAEIEPDEVADLRRQVAVLTEAIGVLARGPR